MALVETHLTLVIVASLREYSLIDQLRSTLQLHTTMRSGVKFLN